MTGKQPERSVRPMETLKSQLQAIRDAEQKATPGWTWFFDEADGIICAQRGREVCRVFIPHPEAADSSGYPTPSCRNDALLIAQALNQLPKLLDALARVITLAEELEDIAGKRQRAAQRARLADRYDLSEAHYQSVKRVRAIKQALLQEIAEAFAANPEPASTIYDYYQGNLTDEPVL